MIYENPTFNRVVPASDDRKWIDFTGDACPVDPETYVSIQRQGFVPSPICGRRAAEWDWNQNYASATRIVRYCVVNANDL